MSTGPSCNNKIVLIWQKSYLFFVCLFSYISSPVPTNESQSHQYFIFLMRFFGICFFFILICVFGKKWCAFVSVEYATSQVYIFFLCCNLISFCKLLCQKQIPEKYNIHTATVCNGSHFANHSGLNVMISTEIYQHHVLNRVTHMRRTPTTCIPCNADAQINSVLNAVHVHVHTYNSSIHTTYVGKLL